MFTSFSSFVRRVCALCKKTAPEPTSPPTDTPKSVAPTVTPIEPVAPVTQTMGNRVLIAEDNSINIKMMRLVLARYAFEVEVAEDGVEALEMAKKGGYDFILMDIDMPNMDGISSTQAIKAYQREHGLPLTPIIALTTHDRAGEREAIMQAGLDEHLGKPLDVYALQKIIEKFRRA
ncbi:MAG: hypothetical protein KU37_09465 [Sulfuricurvum sp. PC08-66]|nr:MAG: hypothetical protein KU37_09465 [Sulfuricurvum sp. PC08-66]